MANKRNKTSKGAAAPSSGIQPDDLMNKINGSDIGGLFPSLSSEDIALIAGFATVIADSLALWAILKARNENSDGNVNNDNGNGQRKAGGGECKCSAKANSRNSTSYARFAKGRSVRR